VRPTLLAAMLLVCTAGPIAAQAASSDIPQVPVPTTDELEPPVIDQGPPWGLSPYLQRVARCESINYRPDVVYGPTRGRAGEIGLFQLHPRGLLPLFFARGFTDPWDPMQQAEFATWAFGAGLSRNWSCR